MWEKLRKLHKQKHDVILLQETKLMHDDLNDDLSYRWQQISEGVAYSAPAASSQAGGVAILLSANACHLLTDRELFPTHPQQHRHIILQAKLNQQTVFIHSIYAPVHRSDRPSFFTNITTPPSQGSHIIAGDFNCVVDPQLDTEGDHTLATCGSEELTGWIASLGAIDAWRTIHDNKKEYTSPSGLSRIDLIFISGCFADNYTSHHAPRTIGSDHLCPVLTTSSSENTYKGGHWQLPNWLARPAAQRISSTLNRLARHTDDADYPTLFTSTMKTITSQCQALHKQILRWRKEKTDRAKLRWIRAHMTAISRPTDELIQDAERARRIWISEIEENSRQKRIWAFEKHFGEAERCSRFFLNRPRHNHARIIPGVQESDGTVRKDPASIHTAHTNYWKKLYSKSSGNSEPPPNQSNIDNLTNVQLPRVPDNLRHSLEADISEEDIVAQIKRLPKRKAAGTDGLKAELFQHAPKIWAKILLPIFQKAMNNTDDPLPKPFRESLIILLYKKGCPMKPENYRPIALLNVIAKILSGIHCARLRPALEAVIPNEQTGFVPRRSISENITFIHDAMHFAQRHHPSAIILALDFAKAYDRVQQSVMLAILRRMCFGKKWINLISNMYRNRHAQLSVNGELTDPFPVERGVLQGDPLSPALFIIQCAPLYTKLSQARNTHGIPIPNQRPAPVATFYADDTNLVARSPESAVHLYNIAEWFCTNSGAKLHPNKCIGIPTGPAPRTLPNGIRLLGPTEHTTILGVPMGTSISRQQQVGQVITKMMTKCRQWSHVGRTIEGRLTIVRSIILSTIWYVMAALPTTPKETTKIQAVINNFINKKDELEWGDTARRGNMSNAWFYRSRKQGGWGLPPVLRTIRCRKLALLRNFISETDKGLQKPWHTFVKHMLNEHLYQWGNKWTDIYFWHGVQGQGEFGVGNWGAVAPWWRDVWREWLKLRLVPRRNSLSRAQLMTWPVWNNRLLARQHGLQSTLRLACVNTTTRGHMNAIRTAGFLTFGDFMNPNGATMTPEQLYTAVTVSLSVHQSEHIVPRSACRTLIRLIKALWENAIRKWMQSPSSADQPSDIEWWPATGGKAPFAKCNNKAITTMVTMTEPPPPPLNLIRLRGTPARIEWKWETTALSASAPTRRDLMKRLLRNALPVGAKRIHWATPAQTECLLCNEGATETVEHMLWDCRYARVTWGELRRPWRTARNTHITWEEALIGKDVKLGTLHNAQIEQLWAVVRTCVMRTIWFERNRRYFYPTSPRRSPFHRHHQSRDDIQIHVECWTRRAKQNAKRNICEAIDYLSAHCPAFPKIRRYPHPTNTTVQHNEPQNR